MFARTPLGIYCTSLSIHYTIPSQNFYCNALLHSLLRKVTDFPRPQPAELLEYNNGLPNPGASHCSKKGRYLLLYTNMLRLVEIPTILASQLILPDGNFLDSDLRSSPSCHHPCLCPYSNIMCPTIMAVSVVVFSLCICLDDLVLSSPTDSIKPIAVYSILLNTCDFYHKI